MRVTISIKGPDGTNYNVVENTDDTKAEEIGKQVAAIVKENFPPTPKAPE